MARTIPHRELRNNSSAILREVQAGETIEITNHGEVVAILVPPARRPSSLPCREPRAKGRFSDLPRVRMDHPVQETLDYLRGDR
ncbi:type II toxin-antitoxin system Phd/YefM family antitoxin [Pseudonocardia spinosispora]|uniref:type II toxin-antitoxin system Phd/YefM family antitoxin n=1 Tax=Pseudonocardia spinosispora TaxID=103441 RepID=UPI0003FA730E|nr:type II toxin-antitoxin system prevent-host-death family antitoxin [Pseudonocardia spinosispora]